MRVRRTYKGSSGGGGGKVERGSGTMNKNLKQWTNGRMSNELIERMEEESTMMVGELTKAASEENVQKSWRESARKKKKKENAENKSVSGAKLRIRVITRV